MPRKRNNRKKVQSEKLAAQPKARKSPQSRQVATIGHIGGGAAGLAMAVLASGILRDKGEG